MHCPRCGNTKLQVQSNSKITSSMTVGRSIGKKHAIGSTAYNSIQETYWFCSECGMKFRDLDELENLIMQGKKGTKVCKYFLFILTVIDLCIAFIGRCLGDEDFILLKGLLGANIIFFYPVFGIVWLFMAHDVKKKETEYNDLLPKVRLEK